MHHMARDILRRIKSPFIVLFLNNKGVRYDGLPSFFGRWPDISNEGKMRIGEKCSFRSFRLRHRIAVWKDAELQIGDGAFINDGVAICATQSIKIGSNAKIGDMTYIYDTDFHQVSPDTPTRHSPVSIGNNVWIGAHCMILAGSSIGDHAVIAAGSIVTGDIPARSLAAGSPARVIRTLAVPDGWVRR